MGMGRAEQTGRGTGAASGQEVGGRSAGMTPVVICGWAGGPEGRMGLPKLYIIGHPAPRNTGRATCEPMVRSSSQEVLEIRARPFRTSQVVDPRVRGGVSAPRSTATTGRVL